MNNDERERLVSVEEAVKLLPEIRADVKQLLAAHHTQQGYIKAGLAFVTMVGALAGALLATFWDKVKASL